MPRPFICLFDVLSLSAAEVVSLAEPVFGNGGYQLQFVGPVKDSPDGSKQAITTAEVKTVMALHAQGDQPIPWSPSLVLAQSTVLSPDEAVELTAAQAAVWSAGAGWTAGLMGRSLPKAARRDPLTGTMGGMDRDNGATTDSGDGQAMASEPDQDDGPDQGGEPFSGQDADFAQEHASLTVDDFRLDRPAESDATP